MTETLKMYRVHLAALPPQHPKLASTLHQHSEGLAPTPSAAIAGAVALFRAHRDPRLPRKASFKPYVLSCVEVIT